MRPPTSATPRRISRRDIGNDVKKTGDKIENKVGNTDVNVKVDHDEHTNTASNATENKAK